MLYKNGDKYAGEWMNGMIHGEGKYIEKKKEG